MIYHTVLAAALVATASARLYSEDASAQKTLWESFKTQYGKKFATMELENRRFEIFLENLKVADLRNEREKKAGGSAVHGITKFSDMSQAEFESTMLTADASLKVEGAEVDATLRVPVTTKGLVDWTGVLTTPVKDQGYCGSCWAFSTTEQIESDSMRLLSQTWVLSAEQVTQCAPVSQGCNGGWTEAGFAYAKSNAIVLDSLYPYTAATYWGHTGECTVDSTQGLVKVSSYTKISGESNMAAYVQSTGPLSVCLDASSWNSYTGGIMSVCGTSVDHCVQAVGVDASTGGYWKVRNSWGTSWGESGYIRLAYGQNTCDITNDPIYSVVKNA